MVALGLGDVDVTGEDIADGWRSLDEAGTATAETLLGRAAPILKSQSPGLLDRLTAGVIPPEAVEQVLIQAVRRALLPALVNPDGVKRVSKTYDGEYTESMEWDTTALAAGLYFTPRELASLDGVRPRRGKAYTINTTPRY